MCYLKIGFKIRLCQLQLNSVIVLHNAYSVRIEFLSIKMLVPFIFFLIGFNSLCGKPLSGGPISRLTDPSNDHSFKKP